jgi:hypothetical protein
MEEFEAAEVSPSPFGLEAIPSVVQETPSIYGQAVEAITPHIESGGEVWANEAVLEQPYESIVGVSPDYIYEEGLQEALEQNPTEGLVEGILNPQTSPESNAVLTETSPTNESEVEYVVEYDIEIEALGSPETVL